MRAIIPPGATVPEPITEEVEEEVIEPEPEPPPETDIQPHVNVGPQFQTNLPRFIGDKKKAVGIPAKEAIMWDPDIVNNLTEEEVLFYQDFACCAAIPGNGTNKEFALHLLQLCNGDVKEAMLKLMKGEKHLGRARSLLSYDYLEVMSWSTEEVEAYQNAMLKYNKDFFLIAAEVGTKSVKECVQFYYLWKKVCSDEYKRLRIVRRRRREQDELYNLRSKAAVPPGDDDGSMATETKPDIGGDGDGLFTAASLQFEGDDKGDDVMSFSCNHPGCNATFSSKHMLKDHMKLHAAAVKSHYDVKTHNPSHHSKDHSYDNIQYPEEFPCRLCGRVFLKVKSRNAHMKSHRQVENTHSNAHC